VEETAIGTFADALLASDAEDGIDRDSAKRRRVFVGNPEHAIFHRTVFHAGGRAGASGTALGDDGELFRLLLARGGKALGSRFKLELVGNHPDCPGSTGLRRHRDDYTSRRCWLLAFGCWPLAPILSNPGDDLPSLSQNDTVVVLPAAPARFARLLL